MKKLVPWGLTVDFRWVTLTLTLVPAIGHTVVHHSSTSTDIPNFIEIGRKKFSKVTTEVLVKFRVTWHTRSSADADNRLDAFSGQLRSTNMVPFHMLHIVSYCAIVTLSLRCAVFTIFVFQKFHDVEMGSKVTQGHWEWYHSIDCVWFPISVL